LYCGNNSVDGIVGLSGDSWTLVGGGESVIKIGNFVETCFYEAFKKLCESLEEVNHNTSVGHE